MRTPPQTVMLLEMGHPEVLGWEAVYFYFELGGQGVDDDGVVDPLMQAAGDDGADAAGSGEQDGKASAVHGVVGEGEAVALFNCFAVEFQLQADGVGGAAEAHDDVAFAANPVQLAGWRAFGCGEEEGATGDLDLEGHGGAAGEGIGAEAAAELPGGVGAEGRELKLAFLNRNSCEIGLNTHRQNPPVAA